LANPLGSQAQSQIASRPKFEVVSIKRCEAKAANATGRKPGLSTSPGRLNVTCSPVKFLMQAAYAASPDAAVPISGGPSWLDSDTYDIEAKAESEASLETMRGPMLQTLLEDRFQLRIHRETKEVPVYDLVVGKKGAKLQAFVEGSCIIPGSGGAPAGVSRQNRPAMCGSFAIGLKGTKMTLDVHKRSVTEFSQQLHLDRPVIDKTGIAGMFDFHLEFAPDATTAGFFPPGFAIPTAADSLDNSSIFTAIQEQLGLRLEAAKGPGELLVIDNVQRPSEN
jgi:uncharacterized protein (TIGR03435 family)